MMLNVRSTRNGKNCMCYGNLCLVFGNNDPTLDYVSDLF